MKAVIIGNNDQHSLDMISAFVLGWNDSRNIYNPKNLNPIDSSECFLMETYDLYIGMLYAYSNNIPLAIKSTSGASSVYNTLLTNPDFTDFYPSVILFMPTGRNEVGEIYTHPIIKNMCITGAGDLGNETADNVEFIWEDPIYNDPQDYSSFSNSYIAAQLLFIAETLNISIWDARKQAMETATEKGFFHETNGYGFIKIQDAIEFLFDDFQQRVSDKKYKAKSYKPFFLKKVKPFVLQKKIRNSYRHKFLICLITMMPLWILSNIQLW